MAAEIALFRRESRSAWRGSSRASRGRPGGCPHPGAPRGRFRTTRGDLRGGTAEAPWCPGAGEAPRGRLQRRHDEGSRVDPPRPVRRGTLGLPAAHRQRARRRRADRAPRVRSSESGVDSLEPPRALGFLEERECHQFGRGRPSGRVLLQEREDQALQRRPDLGVLEPGRRRRGRSGAGR